MKIAFALSALLLSFPVFSAEAEMDHSSMHMGDSSMDMSGMDMSNGAMDHSGMDMGKGSMDMSHMNHGAMNMGSMGKSGKAPPDARSPDYSQGRDFGPIAPPKMMGNGIMASVLINQLEAANSNGKINSGYDVDAWIGTDWSRLAFKAEGETADSKLEEARTELLWRKPVDTFWNTELGVRHDSGKEKRRTWLALGIDGMSPYWIDLGGTIYFANQNRAALRLEATYDWRVTQRMILQPTVETNLYSKDDAERDVGKGLSDLQAGLRLRYEVTRQFAPYIGVESTYHYRRTADMLRAKGESTQNTLLLVGLRFWL